jgi:hypothetical protein
LGSGPLYGNLAVCVFQIPFTWLIIKGVPAYRGDDKHRPGADEVDRKDVEQGEEEQVKDVATATVHELQSK